MEESIIEQAFENRFKIAKVRNRILSYILDNLIFFFIFVVMGIFFGTPNEQEFSIRLTGLPAFAMIIIGFFLWPISEGLYGKTIGKRITGLQVVDDNFKPIGIGKALVRFFIGFIDHFFLIGIIMAATNKQNKRLGDMVASTLVVSEDKESQ